MNNKIIYGIIILCIVCIVCIILVSVLSTGYKVLDYILVISSGIGILVSVVYLIYKNKKTAKVAPDSLPNSLSGSADDKDLDQEPLKLSEVKINILLLDTESDQQQLTDRYNEIINSIFESFESSLLKMTNLENKEYLEKYTYYKNNLIHYLNFIQGCPENKTNKGLLTILINNNIYKKTIDKYDPIDGENYNNIKQLFNHFINYFIKKSNEELYNLVPLSDNLIADLTKLKEVILSMTYNNIYKKQFDDLITEACNNPELNYPYDLKIRLTELKIKDYKTPAGKGEGDVKIMREFIYIHNKCYNKIETYLIGNTDEKKIDNYTQLMKYIIDVYNTEVYNTVDYYDKILTYFKPGTPLSAFENWIKTCIISNNN